MYIYVEIEMEAHRGLHEIALLYATIILYATHPDPLRTRVFEALCRG